MEGLGVDQGHDAVQIHGDRVDLAIRQREVRLARQTERIVQETLFGDLNAALDQQRTADSVDALGEGREDQGIATVDEVIVDRDDANALSLEPVGVVEHDRLSQVELAEAIRRDRQARGGVREARLRRQTALDGDLATA